MSKRVWRLVVFTVIVSSLAALFLAVAINNYQTQNPVPHPNTNRLAIGSGGSAETIDIPIRAPEEFDGKSRGQILDLRREAVMQYPALLANPYAPDEAAFGGIEDGLSWWGMSGLFYYGSGESSIEGVSEESRYILNPYLLVAPEFYGFSYIGNPAFGWSGGITDEMVNAPDFPLTCMPQNLRWYPSEARAEVTYDITACMEAMNIYIINPVTAANATFDMTSYNARDFNLNYIRLQDNNSPVPIPYNGFSPQQINQFLHDVDNCGYSSRCNNRSPYYVGTGDYWLTTLPSSITAELWRDNPPELDTPPDMEFTIHLE